MARYRGPVKKLSRNLLGSKPLDGFPKTERIRRAYPSGQHGQGRKKLSEYATQLKEKQKLRFMFGLSEKQFRSYYDFSVRKQGVTGTVLLQRLESRLDNLIFRSGFARSRWQARQLVSHAHILVNGKKVTIASYICRVGDVITVRERSKPLLAQLIEANAGAITPDWLRVDPKGLVIEYMVKPERESLEQSINEQLIIEFYSR